jgi:hypothetical protein
MKGFQLRPGVFPAVILIQESPLNLYQSTAAFSVHSLPEIDRLLSTAFAGYLFLVWILFLLIGGHV